VGVEYQIIVEEEDNVVMGMADGYIAGAIDPGKVIGVTLAIDVLGLEGEGAPVYGETHLGLRAIVHHAAVQMLESKEELLRELADDPGEGLRAIIGGYHDANARKL
jgi:hypothetical protein